MVTTDAHAKINLSLHVTGQRPDGYHEIDSLVCFVAYGDRIDVRESAQLSLTIDGPEAAGLTAGSDNLVLRAARGLSSEHGAAITLTKSLPVASGIGGGSSDAAATLRALSQLWDLPLPGPADLLSLGADVPVCVEARSCRIQGIGERVTPIVMPPKSPAVMLVNPRVGLSTPAVFRQLRSKENPPMPDDLPAFAGIRELVDFLADQRNDLQMPAVELCPTIKDVLAAIESTGPLLTRMSGSGATCFGVFADESMAAIALTEMRQRHPQWWSVSSLLI